jgi:DNA polymerase III alpha subunit (gram-positive type)
MPTLACVDLETTGSKIEHERIIEIGLILQDLDTGAERFRFVRRINPLMHISAKATAVHGMTDADVMRCSVGRSTCPTTRRRHMGLYTTFLAHCRRFAAA